MTRVMPGHADVLAVGSGACADEESCRAAAAQLAHASVEAMMVAQQPDGHWLWTIVDHDGHPLAHSPAAYPDAVSCGRALTFLRHELATLAAG